MSYWLPLLYVTFVLKDAKFVTKLKYGKFMSQRKKNYTGNNHLYNFII